MTAKRKLVWHKDSTDEAWYANVRYTDWEGNPSSDADGGHPDGEYVIREGYRYVYNRTYRLSRRETSGRPGKRLGTFDKLAHAKAAAEADRLEQ